MTNDTLRHPENVEILVCPETKLRLLTCTMAEAEDKIARGSKLVSRRKRKTDSFQSTTVLLREDYKCAYPVIDGIPILMVPEMLTAEGNIGDCNLVDPKYAEAYMEMEYYNKIASKEAKAIKESEAFKIIEPILRASDKQRSSFPYPRNVWLDAIYDCAAQWDAYMNIAPVKGRRVLQLGGKGIHAVKFLLAGAEESWLTTPMVGEVSCAIALADAAGVSERFRYVVAVAEELPFVSNIFDAIYSGGCLHHMVISAVLPECVRVLRSGGKFGAADPWRTPLYKIGTKILGKREPNVHCQPLTNERIEALYSIFRHSCVKHHGTITRYPLLALAKFGISSCLPVVWWLNRIDDAICSVIPGFRRFGSSVAVLGDK